jgi:hypothetical protein
MILIEEAIAYIFESQLNTLNFQSIAIANLGCVLLKAQGVKQPRSEWINPYPTMIERRKARESINSESAKVFVELSKIGAVPRWVLNEFSDIITAIQYCVD